MVSVQAVVQEFLSQKQSENLSAATLKWYDSKLRGMLDLLPEDTSELTRARVATIINEMKGERRSDLTVHGYAQVLKTFLHYLAEEELIPYKVYALAAMPKVEQRLIPTLSQEAIDAILEACRFERVEWLRARDRALLRFMLDTGARASEVCGLRADNFLLDPRDPYAKLFGKGKKEREVGPLSAEGMREFRRYFRVQPRKGSDIIFLSRYHQPMTPGGLDQMLYRLRKWAGLEGVEVRAHVFRHTYAVSRLREGMDIKRLSLLLGHNSVVVTERYTRDFHQREARHDPARK